MTAIFSHVSSVLNSLKSTFTTIWNAIKSVVTTAVNGIKTVISGISSVVSGVVSTFNRVKEAITKPFETARDKVKSIIDKIKGFFPLSIGKIFSNIKLPHISVSGGKAPFGIAGKGSLPKFSVTWGAKGGILNAPNLIGAGEAGKEALLPLDPFWRRIDNIGEQLANQNAATTDQILLRMMNILEYIAESDKSIKWNNREVGRLINEVM